MRVRLERKTHTRREGEAVVSYSVGDVFDVSDREFAALRDRVSVVQEQVSEPAHGPESETEDAEDSKDALRVQAAELGIEVDARWGVRRLKAEIEKAEAGSA